MRRTVSSYIIKVLLLTGVGPFFYSGLAQVQKTGEVSGRLHVFIDCSSCDQDYIRKALTYINYVRDPAGADVHYILTSRTTGSGGTKYTNIFIGKRSFQGINDTISTVSQKTDSDDTRRKSIVHALSLGLVRYVAHSQTAQDLSVRYVPQEAETSNTDPWDSWVFSGSLNGFLNGESQYNSNQFWSRVNAGRVTDDWKFSISLNMSYNESTYHVQTDDSTTVDSKAVNRSQWLTGGVIKSVSDHWSAGIFTYVNSATYSNIDIAYSTKIGLEYDVFPYQESTVRQLRLGYQIGVGRKKYIDTTIYFKHEEWLYSHLLSAGLSIQQTWGSASITIAASQFLHNLHMYNVSISGNAAVRVIEGLSINLSGGYEAVHDQISLAKSSLTVEQVYQQQRELLKNYSYWLSYGLSYTFGSIFNSVVNPRMAESL